MCGYCDIFVGMCGERLGCLEGEMCLHVEEEMGNGGSNRVLCGVCREGVVCV